MLSPLTQGMNASVPLSVWTCALTVVEPSWGLGDGLIAHSYIHAVLKQSHLYYEGYDFVCSGMSFLCP